MSAHALEVTPIVFGRTEKSVKTDEIVQTRNGASVLSLPRIGGERAWRWPG